MIDSMLLGAILTNIEVAYNLSKGEIDQLQKCHESALRKLLSLPSKTPKVMLYLLTGSIPIEFTIPRRRLVYLHHILNRDENSLLRTFFEHQIKTRESKDWAIQVLKDLTQFDIKLTMDEIRSMPEATWKQLVRNKSIAISLEFLNSNQGSKSRQ